MNRLGDFKYNKKIINPLSKRLYNDNKDEPLFYQSENVVYNGDYFDISKLSLFYDTKYICDAKLSFKKKCFNAKTLSKPKSIIKFGNNLIKLSRLKNEFFIRKERIIK